MGVVCQASLILNLIIQALSVNMEVLNRVDHKLKFGAASVKRQKEIFGMIDRGEWPNIDAGAVPEISN